MNSEMEKVIKQEYDAIGVMFKSLDYDNLYKIIDVIKKEKAKSSS